MSNKTAWIIGLTWLLGAELYLAASRKPLLSDAVWETEGRFPIIPFGLGFVAGHFVWQSARFMAQEQTPDGD